MGAEDDSSARLAASGQRLKRSSEALQRSRLLLDAAPAARLINRPMNSDKSRPAERLVQDQFRPAGADRFDPESREAGIGAWAATTAAAALGAQAATVTLSTGSALRECWGASDHAGVLAEQLDFTAGEGACMTAHVDGGLIVAAENWITCSWPGFAALLTARTGFRSAIAVPLPELGQVAVLTAYFHDPRGCWTVDLASAAVVAGQIASKIDAHVPALPNNQAEWFDLDDQPWPVHDRRRSVPVAAGMLMAARSVSNNDAMTLLRAHAFATTATIDDLAADLVTGRVDARTWRAQPGGRSNT